MGCIKEADSSDYQATFKTDPAHAQSNQDSTGDPVNVVTGAFTLREQDVSFPTQRLRVELARNYNNQRHVADRNIPPGPFGRGWTHSFHLYLQPGPQPGQVAYMDDQGSPIVFQPDEAQTYTQTSGAPGVELHQLPAGGFALRLAKDVMLAFDADGFSHKPQPVEVKANGTTRTDEKEKRDQQEQKVPLLKAGPGLGQVTYVSKEGESVATFVWKRRARTYIAPPGAVGMELTESEEGIYRLRQIDGLIAHFDALGRITVLLRPGFTAESRISMCYDELGRLIEISGAGGRAIRFGYQDNGPLIGFVTDHTGRRWNYRYNDWQELVEVRDPLRRVRRYEYKQWDGWISDNKGQTAPRTIRAMHIVFRHTQEGEQGKPEPEVCNHYTSDRRVYLQEDALGGKTRFEYNRFTRTTQVTDPAGWTTVYCYDDAGNTTKFRQPRGGTTEYIFDKQRNLVAEVVSFQQRANQPDSEYIEQRTEYVTLKNTQRLESERQFGRRRLGNRSEYVTPTEGDIAVGYDRRGNRPLIRDALGNTTYFYDYTRFGKPQRVVRPDGSEIRFTYDERNGLLLRREQEVSIGRTEPARSFVTWAYDQWGNVTRQAEWAETTNKTHAPKRVAVFEYDTHGHHPTSMRTWTEAGEQGEAFAAEERYEWDALGRLVSLAALRRNAPGAQPQQFTTRFGYDALDRQIWQIDAEGTAICTSFDQKGRVIETFLVVQATPELLTHIPHEQREERRRWSYDAMGREISFTTPIGAVTTQTRDARGLCTVLTDPLGHETHYEYDRDGNQLVRRMVTGYELNSEYDTGGRLIAQHDSLGQRVSYSYDALNRVQSVTEESIDGNPAVTQYSYDELGRIACVCAADGAWERLTYDEHGNLVRRQRGQGTDPALSEEVYTYDALGRLTEVLVGTPLKQTRQFTMSFEDAIREVQLCDAVGNITRTHFDSEGNVICKIDGESRVLHMEYDGIRRIRRRWSPEGSVESHYHYDPTGRLLSAHEGPVTHLWLYDSAGRVTRHEQTVEATTEAVVYEYDKAGRPTFKGLGQGWWMRYHYAPESPFLARIDIPGNTITITTDPAGRVTEERWSNGGRTAYAYQPDGSLMSLTSFNEQQQQVFAQHLKRDACGRPIEERRQYPQQQAHYQYQYDALDRLVLVGNRQEQSFNEFRRYTYDERSNRLEEYRNGKLHAKCSYDLANRLIETHYGQGNVERSEYDRSGNLIRKGMQRFHYDTAQRLRQVMLERPGEGFSPTVEYQYAATDERVVIIRPHGAELLIHDGVEEIVSESPAGRRNTFWGLQLDTLLASALATQNPQRAYTTCLGSVVAVGAAHDFRDYDPFGNLTLGAASSVPIGFCGKRYDSETGFYYNRARIYDPDRGRFTQPDAKGMIDGANVYAYARSNPLRYLDQFGFSSVKDAQGKLASTFDIRFASPMDFNLNALNGKTMEHTDPTGWHTIGKTYLVNSHLEHYSGGKLVGTTYRETSGGGGWGEAILGLLSMGLLPSEGPAHLAHYDASGHRIGTTYQESSHLAHYGIGDQRIGTTYQETSGGGGWTGTIMGQLFGWGGAHLGHYNAIGTQATGRTYIS